MMPEMVLFELLGNIKIEPAKGKDGSYNLVRKKKTDVDNEDNKDNKEIIGEWKTYHNRIKDIHMYCTTLKVDNFTMKCSRPIDSKSATFDFSYNGKDTEITLYPRLSVSTFSLQTTLP